MPKTLREAIAELERSKVARAAFGDRVVDHYLHTARLEQQALHVVARDALHVAFAQLIVLGEMGQLIG